MRRVVVLALLATFAGGCAADPEAIPKPERIILFSMDTVRADRIAGYGAPENATPALAQIAKEAVLFRDVYAAANYTIPAQMSIFTGLDPFEHGVYVRGARLQPKIRTLAERLREVGYRTQAFHEGVYVAARFGFDRGFDEYRQVERLGVARSALPRVLDWMRSADEPYFLFLHSYAAHYPYGGFDRYRREHPERNLPSREELTRRALARSEGPLPAELKADCTLHNQLAERHGDRLRCGSNRLAPSFQRSEHFESDLAAILTSYEDRIRTLDSAIASIRELLIELGQWEGTLFVITSDHGEAFFEHGLYRHDYIPFDEVLRVPLIVSFPRLGPEASGRIVPGLVSHADLAPTLLGLAGALGGEDLPGRDLTAVLRGGQELPSDHTVFPAILEPIQRAPEPLRRVAVRGSLKYIEGHERFGDREGLLFDMDADPAERRNLRATRKVEFEEIEALTRNWASGLEPGAPVDQRSGETLVGNEPAPELSPVEHEQLRALGYVD